MAAYEIHLTAFVVSADKLGWVSFWCRSNILPWTVTVPRYNARYDWWVYKDGVEICHNAIGQPGDFRPGDVVTKNNMYVGEYLFGPGTYVVKVQWQWWEGPVIVSDTKTYTIKPEELEGTAVIASIEVPDSFTPNVSFNVTVHLLNDGVGDMIFARLINKDTGATIDEGIRYIGGGGGLGPLSFSVTLPQKTDFRGKIEAGHET